jgi:hypothetical protein
VAPGPVITFGTPMLKRALEKGQTLLSVLVGGLGLAFLIALGTWLRRRLRTEDERVAMPIPGQLK